jgi:hypothetical protein
MVTSEQWICRTIRSWKDYTKEQEEEKHDP